MPFGYRETVHDRCKNPANSRRSVINSDKVPASGEVVNDGRQTALSHGTDSRFGSRSKPGAKTSAKTSAKAGAKSGRGWILSGIGENTGKTPLFPRISKPIRGHYDNGTATESRKNHFLKIG
jgi:hypothetical protein